MTFDIVSKTNCPKSEPPILLCERYQLDLFFTHQFLNASVLYGSCLDCGSIDKVGDLWMSMRKWPSEEFCPWWSQLPSRITRYASDHHSIKCLISVLGRALFFYQDFHFDFLLQYSLSYCWEDRPVSKEKPRSIRCFFFIFVFFLLLVVGISTTLPKKSWLRGLSSEYFSFETSLILAFLVCSNAEPFKIGLVS